MCEQLSHYWPYAVFAAIQLLPGFAVELLNHQVVICVVSGVEVCDDTGRNAKNSHHWKT